MATDSNKKIWTDGCFDMFHYGHANALRQAKGLGSYLIAGVHSSLSINQEKGLPVMEDEERYEVVQACRYVDEVVTNVPFVTQADMVKSYGVDVVAHGNDIVLNKDGQDSYFQVRELGMFKEVRRTLGISTTEIVGRMLLNNRGCSAKQLPEEAAAGTTAYRGDLLEAFRASMPRERRGRVVFVDGNFDLLHAGHTTALRIARELGDYLVVGIHNEETATAYTRTGTVMDAKERMLALMSCRHVDEVVVSPYVVSQEFVEENKIDVVGVSLDIKDMSRYNGVKDMVRHSYAENKFAYLSAEHIVNRIISNYQRYAARQKKRNAGH